MSRLFWMAVGATAGVVVTCKVTRTVDRFAPGGLAAGLSGLGETVRDFADEVLASMAEREWELRESLGLATVPPTVQPLRAVESAGQPDAGSWRYAR